MGCLWSRPSANPRHIQSADAVMAQLRAARQPLRLGTVDHTGGVCVRGVSGFLLDLRSDPPRLAALETDGTVEAGSVCVLRAERRLGALKGRAKFGHMHWDVVLRFGRPAAGRCGACIELKHDGKRYGIVYCSTHLRPYHKNDY